MNTSRLGARTRTSVGLLTLLAALTGSAIGCGGKKGKGVSAEGKITYKGTPVPGGTIKLFPTSGKESSQAIAQDQIKNDGTFKLAGVPPGTYRVVIETESVKNMMTPMPMGGPGGPPPGAKVPKFTPPPGMDMPKYMRIPTKYMDPGSSGLTWDLKDKDNKQNFDLTD